MIEKSVNIHNKLGLHARSASAFVKVAKNFSSKINVANQYANADGKSIMSMMLLQAAYGTTIQLSVDGVDEEAAICALTALINDKFGESE